MNLPLDELRAVAIRELDKAGARPLFITISGAHLYGFASPDSDFDIRGAHLLPLKTVLSMRGGAETIEHSGVEGGRELDVVSHDAGKFFALMLKRNGYVMEQVFSPLEVVGGPALEELRSIARGCITRHLYHHYRGFTENELKLLAKEPRIKTLLYVYRVLLTGIHVLKSGEIEANLPKLLELHPQDAAVRELIAAKTRERAPLSESDLASHRARIDTLRAALDDAFASSRLPQEPVKARDLDDLLVRLRLG